MVEIHNRQPVILEPKKYAEWLEESGHLLRVMPDEEMTIDVVTKIEPVKPDVSRQLNRFSLGDKTKLPKPHFQD